MGKDKKKIAMFLIIILITLSGISYKAYSKEVVLKELSFHDTHPRYFPGKYGTNEGGIIVVGGEYRPSSKKDWTGDWGYYGCTQVSVDLGKIYGGDPSHFARVQVAGNQCKMRVEYSVDNKNWKWWGEYTAFDKGAASSYGPNMDGNYAWCANNQFRYFRVIIAESYPDYAWVPSKGWVAQNTYDSRSIDMLEVTVWGEYDDVAPSIKLNQDFSGWSKNNQNLKSVVTDNGVGINEISLPNYGSNWNTNGDNNNKTSITSMSKEGWYNSQTVRATDKNNNAASSNFNSFGIDKTPPQADSLKVTLKDPNTLAIQAVNVRDSLSGLKDNTVRAAIWKDGESYRDWYTLHRQNNTNNFYAEINLDAGNHKGKFGSYNVHMYSADNVGNDGFNKSSQFNRISPKPINDTFGIEGEKFTDIRGHWVKTNQEYRIWARAYASERNDDYRPNKIYYSVKNTTDSDEYGAIQTGLDGFSYYRNKTMNYTDNMPLLNNAFKYEPNATSYSNLNTMMKNDNMKVNYWFTSSTDKGGYAEASSWKKMFTVNSDGNAPTGNVIINLNSQTLNLDIDVRNVTDNGGSGVKEVFAMYYDPDNKQNQKTQRELILKNGNWIDNINAYDLFNSDNIGVEVYAIDNVGNTRLLESKVLDLLTVKATIVPYNDKSYSGSKPTLKRGQKGVIKIATTGEPTQLQIIFSNDLLEQDNSLNAIIDLQPKKQLTTEYEFIVPLYADMKDYTVNVNAIKGNKSKESNPQFSVNDSIIDGLRTRRKY